MLTDTFAALLREALERRKPLLETLHAEGTDCCRLSARHPVRMSGNWKE